MYSCSRLLCMKTQAALFVEITLPLHYAILFSLPACMYMCLPISESFLFSLCRILPGTTRLLPWVLLHAYTDPCAGIWILISSKRWATYISSQDLVLWGIRKKATKKQIKQTNHPQTKNGASDRTQTLDLSLPSGTTSTKNSTWQTLDQLHYPTDWRALRCMLGILVFSQFTKRGLFSAHMKEWKHWQARTRVYLMRLAKSLPLLWWMG